MAGKDVPVSPLAPKKFPKMPPIEGVAFATADASTAANGSRRSSSDKDSICSTSTAVDSE